MKQGLKTLTAAMLALLWAGTALAAGTPAQKCQSSKNKAVGKYTQCRENAEAKLATTGDTAKYDDAITKCEAKFQSAWEKAEIKATAAGDACPTSSDQTTVQGVTDGFTDNIAQYLAGGTLEDCPAELVTCNASLTTCNAGTAAAGDVLSGKTFSSNAGLGVAGTMANNGAVTITPGTTPQTIAAGFHNGSGTVAGDANLVSGNIKSGATVFGVAGSVVEASGNAGAGDVLTGKTFSNASGSGTGSMPNNAAVFITPGTSAQTIAAGYHSGSGNVAGDADLLASNISSGVDIFGVTGTALPGQRLKTGQTQCDQGTQTLGPCPGSPAGQDGSLGKGLTRSYTVNVNGTITDDRTGLIWEKLDDNEANGIHDYSATFTWYDAFKKIQVLNGDATGCIADDNPDACCTGAGTGSCSAFAGQTDWRLPNVNELQSLADYGRVNPSIDPAFHTSCAASCTVSSCSCTKLSNYWSSTTNQANQGQAWNVLFVFGSVSSGGKFTAYHVRAVRGGS